MSEVSNVSPAAGKPPRENLYRGNNTAGAIELRSEGDRGPVLSGHAAVFNTYTEINSAFEGRFLEKIAPGAFAKTISENRDRIRVLFQHGKDPQIGDKPLGPLRTLEEDATGLRYEVDLLPTAYNAELEPGLRAGLYGASFRFSTVREDFVSRPTRSDYNPTGLPERTLQEVRLMELGPVTFGAYPEATSGVRSMTDEFLAAQLFENDAVVDRLAEKLAQKTRTFSVSFNGTKVTNQVSEPEQVPEDRADEEIVEPEQSAATTPAEPEPSEATTRSETSLFWFVADPKLKGANKK